MDREDYCQVGMVQIDNLHETLWHLGIVTEAEYWNLPGMGAIRERLDEIYG